VKRLITVITLLFSINVLAVELIDKKNIKNIGNIHSVTFENSLSISIYLPDGYETNNNKYPVMYVIDGERYFLNSITYQKALTWQDNAPAFIVVGINTAKKERRELLGNKSLEFIDIFQNQIINYVEKNYRTKDMRMYFGWEMAGGFALDLFAKKPNLIHAYFLASSTHFTPERLDSVNKALQDKNTTSRFLYYTLGEVEAWSVKSHKTLEKILTNHTKKDFKWEFSLSEKDNHYTTPLDTFNQGLTQYFSGYSPIRFYTLAEFEVFGGLKALKEHYKKRGERFKVSNDVHDDTIHYLLNQSINENNFTQFKILVREFNGFIEEHNYSLGFISKIAKFYENNGAVKEAIYLYKSELLKAPESEKLQIELTRLISEAQL